MLVLLLYRRISSIGRISLFLWAGVVGTILWLIWGGVTHFQPHLVFTYAPGSWDLSWLFFATLGSATVNTIYIFAVTRAHLVVGALRSERQALALVVRASVGHGNAAPPIMN